MTDSLIADFEFSGTHVEKGDVTIGIALRGDSESDFVQLWLELSVQGETYSSVADGFDKRFVGNKFGKLFLNGEEPSWGVSGIYGGRLIFSRPVVDHEPTELLLEVTLSLNVDGITVTDSFNLSDILVKPAVAEEILAAVTNMTEEPTT